MCDVFSQADNDLEHFQTVAGVIRHSKRGKKIGVFSKDNFTGPFVEGWTAALSEVKVTHIDVSAAFSFACAVKDDSEIVIMKVILLVGLTLSEVTGFTCVCDYGRKRARRHVLFSVST